MARYSASVPTHRLAAASLAFSLSAVAAATACGPSRREPATQVDTPEACRDRQGRLVQFVAALPNRALSLPTQIALPESTLGKPIGEGPVVEIAETSASVDGRPLAGATQDERAAALKSWAVEFERSARPGEKLSLYVGAAGPVTVETLRAYVLGVPASVELRLLLRSRGKGRFAGAESARGEEIAARLLAEQDVVRRRQIAKDGYAALADCEAVRTAVSEVEGLEPQKRWPALHSLLVEALPRCDCGTLDAAGLAALVGAEQRAGALSLGWVPLSFVRDERCAATMPLRSVAKLVGQIEAFDEQFAGNWQKDALRFDDVVTDERLEVFFCDALPGETLAARQRARESVYFRVQGAASCEAFRFEPLAPGSPLGTLRRATASRPPLAFHYRQAAEEIRVFGPVDPAVPSNPTDSRDWPCDQTIRFTSIDDAGVTLGEGRWFFGEAECERSKDPSGAFGGCFASRAAQ